MFYMTRDMARALAVKQPYKNLKTFLEYKEKGMDVLRAHKKEIVNLAEEEAHSADEEEPE